MPASEAVRRSFRLNRTGMPMAKTIEVTELALRDAHQSLLATRMALEDMVPACEDIDQAGYWSVECWGGATFDACIRFLNEDPWERLRTFRKLMPNSRLQMLLRGQNLLGYRHYEDSVVDRFVDKAAENGMDVFRIFDALNDLRNIERSVRRCNAMASTRRARSPTPSARCTRYQGYVDTARQLVDMGCESLCIKDMAALLKPQAAYDIVKAHQDGLRRGGARARAHPRHHRRDAGQPDEGHRSRRRRRRHRDQLAEPGPRPQPDREPGRDAGRHGLHDAPGQAAAASHQGSLCQGAAALPGVPVQHHRRRDRDLRQPDPGRDDLQHGKPAAQQKAAHKLKEVLEEVPRVRADAGYPPLVTPSSQIVGTQAVFNVMMGRYKALTGEFADLMLGYYGRTLGERDPAVVKLAEAHAKKPMITERPADRLAPEWQALRATALAQNGCNGTDEDVLTYAMFPQVASGFFAHREKGPLNLGRDPEAQPSEPRPATASADPAAPRR
jgi:methylmalonyl-CoA carboxyltransferase 5S subunit